MINILSLIIKKNSPCRALQIIESKNFELGGDCLEIGNFYLNKKSFFNFFKFKNKKTFYFADFKKKLKKKNYFYFNLEKKNNLKKNFDNIIIFNVLEHVYNFENGVKEIKKIVKNNGHIIISTPFIYRYHQAPNDFNRPTLDFYIKIAKKVGLKILYKKNLGTGPFLASYSLIHSLLKKIYPLNLPILTISIIFDLILNLFSQKLKNYYPICNFVVLKKK
jgi:SAM-dependent methyltransferase